VSDQLNIGREIQRKSIHFATTLIPLAYSSIIPKKEHIFLICVFISIGFLAADLLRLYWKTAEKYFLMIFSALLREDELKNSLTGATYLFVGMTLAVFLFPKDIAIAVMLFLSIADPCAAIVGKSIPIKKIFKKSIGGFLGFLICASVIVTIVLGFSYTGLIVALAAAMVELIPLRLNDNLTIPVVSGYLLIFLK
jgi:glycerol-3-phosphate acyltransferase PlsY